MTNSKIWPSIVAGFSLLLGLSYFLLIFNKGGAIDGQAVQGVIFLLASFALLYRIFKRKMEKPVMSEPLTSQAIAEYECALETLGNVVAHLSEAIHDERAKPHPDKQKIEDMRQQQTNLVIERSRLMIEDSDEIRRVISNYGAQVRAQV
jgi:hypothetical protein